MVTVSHSQDSAAARSTPAQKVSKRTGEPLWKTAGMVVLVMLVIGLFINKAFTSKKKEERQAAVAPTKLVTPEDLTVGLPPVMRPKVEKVEPPRPTPSPTPPPTPAAAARVEGEPAGVSRPSGEAAPPRKPVAVSSIAVRQERAPATPPSIVPLAPRTRHARAAPSCRDSSSRAS